MCDKNILINKQDTAGLNNCRSQASVITRRNMIYQTF